MTALTETERLNVAMLTRLFGHRQDADNPRGFTAPDGRYALLGDLPDYAGTDAGSWLVLGAMADRGWTHTSGQIDNVALMTFSHAGRRLSVGCPAPTMPLSIALGALACLDHEDAGHGAPPKPLATVELHTGRWCLMVAGWVLAMEGDPCRDPDLTDDLHWDRAVLESAASAINEAEARRREQR